MGAGDKEEHSASSTTYSSLEPQRMKMHDICCLILVTNCEHVHTNVHTGGHPNVHTCMYGTSCCGCTFGKDVPYITCACCVMVSGLGAWLVGKSKRRMGLEEEREVEEGGS